MSLVTDINAREWSRARPDSPGAALPSTIMIIITVMHTNKSFREFDKLYVSLVIEVKIYSFAECFRRLRVEFGSLGRMKDQADCVVARAVEKWQSSWSSHLIIVRVSVARPGNTLD